MLFSRVLFQLGSALYNGGDLVRGTTYQLLTISMEGCWLSRPTTKTKIGEGPGLVVIGRDSCSIGCGFKCQHWILDRHLFTIICCNIVKLLVWKRPKIN